MRAGRMRELDSVWELEDVVGWELDSVLVQTEEDWELVECELELELLKLLLWLLVIEDYPF